MTRLFRTALLLPCLLLTLACAGPAIPHDPDVIDVTLPAPASQVKAAVVQVLTDGGYDVDSKDEHTLETGYREEIPGPWDWLLRWRFGTGRSRVQANVTPATEETTRLRLSVQYESKDGIFTGWDDAPTAVPQRADNQLRLIKNKLKLL